MSVTRVVSFKYSCARVRIIWLVVVRRFEVEWEIECFCSVECIPKRTVFTLIFFIMCAQYFTTLLIYWHASTILPAELLQTISPSFPIALGNISSLLWQMCRGCERFRWIRLKEMVPYWRTYLTGSVVGWISALQYRCRYHLWLGARFPEPENVKTAGSKRTILVKGNDNNTWNHQIYYRNSKFLCNLHCYAALTPHSSDVFRAWTSNVHNICADVFSVHVSANYTFCAILCSFTMACTECGLSKWLMEVNIAAA